MGATISKKGKYDPSKNNKNKKTQTQLVFKNRYERDHFLQDDRKFRNNRKFQNFKNFSQTMPDLTDISDDSFSKRRVDPKTRLTLDPSQMYSDRSMRSDDYETISVSLHNIPDADDNIYEEVEETSQAIDEEIAHFDVDEVVHKLKLIKKRIQTFDGSEDYNLIIEDLNECDIELSNINLKNEHITDLHRKIEHFKQAIEKHGKQLKTKQASVNNAIYENHIPSEDKNKTHYQSVVTLFAEITNQLDKIKEEMLNYYGTSQDQQYSDIVNQLNRIHWIVKDVDAKSNVSVILTKEQYEDYVNRLKEQFEVIVQESEKNFKIQKHKLSTIERNKDRRRRSQILDNNINIKQVHGRLSVDYASGGNPIDIPASSGAVIEEEVEDQEIYVNILGNKNLAEKDNKQHETSTKESEHVHTLPINRFKEDSEQLKEEKTTVSTTKHELLVSKLPLQDNNTEDQELYAEVTKPKKQLNTTAQSSFKETQVKQLFLKKEDHFKPISPTNKHFHRQMSEYSEAEDEFFDCEEFLDSNEFSTNETLNEYRIGSYEFINTGVVKDDRDETLEVRDESKIFFMDQTPPDDKPTFKSLFGRTTSERSSSQDSDVKMRLSSEGSSNSEVKMRLNSEDSNSEMKMRLNSEDSNSDHQIEYRIQDSRPTSNAFSDRSSTQQQIEYQDFETVPDAAEEEEIEPLNPSDVADADPTKVKKPRKVSRITMKYIDELKHDYAENLRNLSPTIDTVEKSFSFIKNENNKEKKEGIGHTRDYIEDKVNNKEYQKKYIEEDIYENVTKSALLPEPTKPKNANQSSENYDITKLDPPSKPPKSNETHPKDEGYKPKSFQDILNHKRFSNEAINNTKENNKEKSPSFIQFIPDKENHSQNKCSIDSNDVKHKLQNEMNTAFEQQEEFVEDLTVTNAQFSEDLYNLEQLPVTPRHGEAGEDTNAKMQFEQLMNFEDLRKSEKLSNSEQLDRINNLNKHAKIFDKNNMTISSQNKNKLTFQESNFENDPNNTSDDNVKRANFDDTSKSTHDDDTSESTHDDDSNIEINIDDYLSSEDDDVRKHERFYEVKLDDQGTKHAGPEDYQEEYLENPKEAISQNQTLNTDRLDTEQINLNQNNSASLIETKNHVNNNYNTDGVAHYKESKYSDIVELTSDHAKIDDETKNEGFCKPLSDDLSEEKASKNSEINTPSSERLNCKNQKIDPLPLKEEESKNIPSSGLKLESLIRKQFFQTTETPINPFIAIRKEKSDIMKPDILTVATDYHKEKLISDEGLSGQNKSGKNDERENPEEGIYINMDDLEVKHVDEIPESNLESKGSKRNLELSWNGDEKSFKDLKADRGEISSSLDYPTQTDVKFNLNTRQDVFENKIHKEENKDQDKTNESILNEQVIIDNNYNTTKGEDKFNKEEGKYEKEEGEINKGDGKKKDVEVKLYKDNKSNAVNTEENEDNKVESKINISDKNSRDESKINKSEEKDLINNEYNNKIETESTYSSMEYLNEERDTVPELPSLNVRTYLVDDDLAEVKQKMITVKECLDDIKMCIGCFEGSKQDEEYHNIYENLFSTMSVLNTIKSANWDVINEKQEILQQITKCMSELETKVS